MQNFSNKKNQVQQEQSARIYNSLDLECLTNYSGVMIFVLGLFDIHNRLFLRYHKGKIILDI